MNNDLLTLPQDADPQLVRAEVFISAGDFAAAEVCCDKALDADPKNLHAYLFKIMAKCKIRNASELAAVPDLPELPEFKLARRFADAEFSAKLDGLLREYEAGEGAEVARATHTAQTAKDFQALRAACAVRIRTLRELLAKPLPDDLVAEARQRIEAEQALMRAPIPEAAEREADATGALKDKIVPIYRTQLAELLPKLEKIVPNQNVPQSDRGAASKLCDKIRALLEDPGADLRTLGYESERGQVEFEELTSYLNDSDIRLWIGFLILFAIIGVVFAFWYKSLTLG